MANLLGLSAGLLLYRLGAGGLEVFLVHPGGPFWAKKDAGAWSIPKGRCEEGESALDAARREFKEETGFPAAGPLVPLGEVRQRAGKTVVAWALEGDCDPVKLRSNTCNIEWPPRSGRQLEIPEVDSGEWFPLAEAYNRILAGQKPFLDALAANIAGTTGRAVR